MSRVIYSMLFCLLVPAVVSADDWPQWLGPRRDGVWRETGLVKAFPKDGPRILWRSPLGQGYSGPAVVGERVYVMDRQRAKDADGKPARPTRDGIPGNERIVCLNAKTGTIVWKHEYSCSYTVSYSSGPRVTPLVQDGKLWALGAMGDLHCLDEKTGKPIWHKNLIQEYKLDGPPAWGYAAHPLIVGDLLYTLVGGKGSAVVALNKNTGAQVWKALTTEEIGYSPPVLITAGGKKQLLIWLSESVNGLDPATGSVYWTQEYPVGRPPMRPAVTIATLRVLDNKLFLSSAYHGPMVLELEADKPAVKLLWRGKSNRMDRPEGLHILMATPWLQDGHVYGVCAMGELRCLDLKTGKQKWQTYDLTGGEKADCGTSFIVPQGDRYIVFNDQGELILAELSPKGHKIISKARVIDPIEEARGRKVVWSHPAFARKCVFVRNDKEMVCVSLAEAS
jgi:outer membrane protein assembly factor BamB